MIQRKVEDIFDHVKEDLDAGKRTKEDVIAGFGALFNSVCNPEDITVETVDNDITLITSEDVEMYENEHAFILAENRESKERIAELEREGNLKDKELVELRREKEIRELEDTIRKCDESIRQYTKAVKNTKWWHGLVNGLVVALVLTVIVAAWIIVPKFGWNDAEQYTFLIQLSIEGVVIVVSICGWKIGIKCLATKLGDLLSKKYDSDLGIDVEDVQLQKSSATERLDQLKRQNSCIDE